MEKLKTKIIHFNKDGTFLSLDEHRALISLSAHIEGISFAPIWYASFKGQYKSYLDWCKSDGIIKLKDGK